MASPDNYPSQEPGGTQPRGAARFFGRRPSLQTPNEQLHPDTVPPPPVTLPNSRKRPMLSAMSGILSFLLIAAIGGVGLLSYASSKLAEPGPLSADKVVFIAPRTEVSEIVDQLHKSGVISDPLVLKAALVIDRKWSQVKAGEYLFKQNASLNDVIDVLVSGKAILHSITIPEGLTSTQIVERLRQNELLTGEILEIPSEGTLLPETYRVLRGQARATVIRQMREQQTRLLDQIWERRSPDIPIRSKIELLTMASIIEKETGRADERTRVAAVFYNRLRRGMKLQSDPTIVYGLVGGKGTLGRPIQRDEITRPTRYNTYVIPALPPGPIANPGRASLEAAAMPSRTNDLFFVANGTGGHTFAENLEQHNRNVVRWREIERERAAARALQPAIGGEINQETDRIAPGIEPEPGTPAASPARGRRSDVPGGDVFGAVPEVLEGRTVALADLSRALKSAPLPPLVTGAARGKPAPSSVTAYAPVSATPAAPVDPRRAAAATARTRPEPAPPAAQPAGEPAASKFQIGKGVGDLGLQIAGVDTKPSPLDGPVGDVDEPAGQANMEVYPVGAQRQNEINTRSAMFGRGVTPSGPVETLPMPGADLAIAAAPAAPTVRRVLDASEGTSLDPLRSRGWDLNAAHVVPASEGVPAAAPAAARPAAAKRAQKKPER